MDRDRRSLPPSFFEDLYAADPDPWNFETSQYEQEKYATTLAALPRAHYRSGFEIGCSIGVLTARLAPRCGQLLAVDVSARALARARARCRDLPEVTFGLMRVPQEFPEAAFDLILVSEVGYYWSPEDLARARDLIAAHLEPGGHVLLIHWRPDVSNYPLRGDEVHDFFRAHAGPELRHLRDSGAEQYRLDLYERAATDWAARAR